MELLKPESCKKKLFYAISLFLFCLILIYWKALFTHKSLFWRDTLHTYYPFFEFFRKYIFQGDFPFWNPFLFTGTPQFASPEPPLLYPSTWLFVFIPFSKALTINLILHSLLAALGIYLLGQIYKLQWLTSIFSACSFIFCGIYFSLNNVFPLIWTCSWIPLLIY